MYKLKLLLPAFSFMLATNSTFSSSDFSQNSRNQILEKKFLILEQQLKTQETILGELKKLTKSQAAPTNDRKTPLVNEEIEPDTLSDYKDDDREYLETKHNSRRRRRESSNNESNNVINSQIGDLTQQVQMLIQWVQMLTMKIQMLEAQAQAKNSSHRISSKKTTQHETGVDSQTLPQENIPQQNQQQPQPEQTRKPGR